MKATDVEWKEVKLGEILRFLDERIMMDDEKEYLTITVKRRHGGLEIRERLFGHQIVTKKQFGLVPNAFIISRVQCWHQAYAIVGDVPPNTIASQNYDQFAISPKVDSRFFWWLSHSPAFTETVRSSAVGVVIEKMVFDREEWLTKTVRLPPLAEQRRVVARLEELAAQINEARTLRQEATEETEALLASARAKVISESTGQEHAFDSLVDQLRGASGLPLKEYQQRGRFPVIDQGQQFIGGFCDDESRLLRVTRPVVVWGDHTTNVKLVDFNFVPGADGTKVFQPKEPISAPFLYQILKAVEYPAMGYSRHYRFLKDIPVKIPSPTEQRRIVAELDALQAEVDALKRLQAETAAELDALLPAILDRAFKGELC